MTFEKFIEVSGARVRYESEYHFKVIHDEETFIQKIGEWTRHGFIPIGGPYVVNNVGHLLMGKPV